MMLNYTEYTIVTDKNDLSMFFPENMLKMACYTLERSGKLYIRKLIGIDKYYFFTNSLFFEMNDYKFVPVESLR